MPVYKDKNNNSWFFKCSINGKQYLKRGYPTKKDAANAEVVFKVENQDECKKIIKFNDAVNLYLNYLKKELKPTTYYGYTLVFNKYILPSFRNIPVNKLLLSDFNSFRAKLAKANLKDKNRIINYVVAMFDYLYTFYDLNVPYAKRISKFKNYDPKKINTELNKPVEFDLFKKYYLVANDYFRFYLLTTYSFGLRISEIRGLQVDSFDLNNNLLYIYKVTTSKAGVSKSIDLVPKSKSSIRKYYLSDCYLKILNDFIHDNNLKKGNRLFFSGIKKKNVAISENCIRLYLKSLEKTYNLSHITPHGLRHGIASYLYSKKIPFEDIGKYLGHKFNSVTMDVYIDLTKERQKTITSEIDKMIQELED